MKIVSIDDVISVTEEGFVLQDGEKILFSQCKTRGPYFYFDYSIGYAPNFDLPCYEFRFPTEADQLRVTCKNRKSEKWKTFARYVGEYRRKMGYRRFDMS